jgi:hypothetical protein
MDEMRIDRGSLQAQHPQYAEELNQVRGALDNPLQYTDALDDPDETWQTESQRQKEADERLDELLSKIHKEPGFEDYLLPPSEADMKAAAEKGPIVVINVSRFRCDASIIETDRLRLLPLPKLTLSDIEGTYQMQQIEPQPHSKKSTPFQIAISMCGIPSYAATNGTLLPRRTAVA